MENMEETYGIINTKYLTELANVARTRTGLTDTDTFSLVHVESYDPTNGEKTETAKGSKFIEDYICKIPTGVHSGMFVSLKLGYLKQEGKGPINGNVNVTYISVDNNYICSLKTTTVLLSRDSTGYTTVSTNVLAGSMIVITFPEGHTPSSDVTDLGLYDPHVDTSPKQIVGYAGIEDTTNGYLITNEVCLRIINVK